MIRRTLHISWMTLSAIVVVLVSAAWYVGWTESGFRRISSLLSRPLGRVTLQLTGPSGTLAGGARVQRLVLDHKRSHIEVDNLELKLAMLPLLWQTIRAESITMDRLAVRVLPRGPEESQWRVRFLPPLLTLRVDELTVRAGTLTTTRNKRYDATRLSASGAVHSDHIRVYRAALDYADIDVQADGELRAARPVQLTGVVRFEAEPAGQPRYAGHADLAGDLAHLAIEGEITAPFAADFTGAATALNADWQWSGDSSVKRLDLTAWQAGDALGIITGKLALTGNANGFQVRGTLLPPGLEAGPLAVDFDGNYGNRWLSVRSWRFVHEPSGSTLAASGRIGIVPGGPRLELVGDWHTLRWPLADEAAPVQSAQGRYTLNGLLPFTLNASGELAIEDWPTMQFEGSGQLASDRLTVEQSNFAAFGGNAALTGVAYWSPAETWTASGRMSDFDVNAFRPGIRGRLNFDISASGAGYGAGSTMESTFGNLGGNVRGQRASGQAHVASADQDWLLDNVRLQLGATRIAASGRVGTVTDLQFDVTAEDLALFAEGARGKLAARGALRGGEQPLLRFRATGTGLQFQDFGAQELTAELDFDPSGNGNGNIQVQLGGALLAGQQFDTLQFTTRGPANSHEVGLRLRAPRLRLDADGAGGYGPDGWQWRITQMRLDDARQLKMALAAPARLQISTAAQTLEPLCLVASNARLCVDGQRQAGVRSLHVNAERMPIQTLTAGLSRNTEFTGLVAGRLQLRADANGQWSGSLQSELTDGAAQHRLRSGRSERFAIGSGSINATLQPDALSGQLALDAGSAGFINGKLNAQASGARLADWPLRGELHLESTALSILDSYLGAVDRITGRLSTDLALGGTLGAPSLNGELKVSDAEVDAYQVNLALRELNFSARLNDSKLSLNGSTKAGVEGSANFSGELSWRDQLPYGQLRLQGKDLRIVNVPEARVQASPDVTLKLAGRRIDVSGVIDVPYARLEPAEFANALLVSRDEVLVNEPQTPPEEQFKVYGSVTLRLGERVTINTSGLSGRLSGSVAATTDETGISRGRGELNVEEGKYTAYGRKLDIERGRLVFSNAPLYNPNLDLRATKRFPDITAGVNVRGTLQDPKMSFFSDPAVTQSQIVSLLLAGGSLDSVQNSSDPAARSNAARSSAVLQGSAILAQQTGLGTRLGIEDVSVESDLNNETSLVLGRYLSPRLYLSYGIGLAETLNTLKLRYTIGDHWTIRTESGQERSADLLYTIEK